MIYQAKILKIKYMEDYEGLIHICINNTLVLAWYLAPYNFAKEYLCINKTIPIDFWLLNGTTNQNNTPVKYFPNDLKAGGIVKGQVTKKLSPNEFRIDCGPFEIDIFNEVDIELYVGDYLVTEGTYQIFFPGTEYSKQDTWE